MFTGGTQSRVIVLARDYVRATFQWERHRENWARTDRAIVQKCQGGYVRNVDSSPDEATRRERGKEARNGENERETGYFLRLWRTFSGDGFGFIVTLESEKWGSLLRARIYCRGPVDWLASVVGDDISIVGCVHLDREENEGIVRFGIGERGATVAS